MLDGGADALLLNTMYVTRADSTGQQRILGVTLEMAATEWAAVQVHGRGQQHVDTLAASLLSQQSSSASSQDRVPGRGQRRWARQGDRPIGRGPLGGAHADRTVGHHE